MDDAPLLIEHLNETISVFTLNRPHRRNALTVELMNRLCDALRDLEYDPRHRIVILRGNGPAFCAGLDLTETADVLTAERAGSAVARMLAAVTGTSLVTIAAVHGAAMAGGAGLMAACDFVVAADSVRIGFPEVRRGLVPALVTTVLRHRLRDRDLRELFLLAEPIAAQHAKEMGLIHQLVPESDVFDASKRLAETILLGGPDAVRRTKRLLKLAADLPDAEFHHQALHAHQHARASHEAAEGLAAFHEKRPPDWNRIAGIKPLPREGTGDTKRE